MIVSSEAKIILCDYCPLRKICEVEESLLSYKWDRVRLSNDQLKILEDLVEKCPLAKLVMNPSSRSLV